MENDKPAWAKSCEEMTHQEMVDWATGELILAIGKGDFHSKVWMIISVAWNGGMKRQRDLDAERAKK